MSAFLPLFLSAFVFLLVCLMACKRTDPKHRFMVELLTRVLSEESSDKSI